MLHPGTMLNSIIWVLSQKFHRLFYRIMLFATEVGFIASSLLWVPFISFSGRTSQLAHSEPRRQHTVLPQEAHWIVEGLTAHALYHVNKVPAIPSVKSFQQDVTFLKFFFLHLQRSWSFHISLLTWWTVLIHFFLLSQHCTSGVSPTQVMVRCPLHRVYLL